VHLRQNTLPGFFRPTKDWDLVVMLNHPLLASPEFKSQVGPSFGNNFNNRVEEAVGSATDLWTAYREEAFAKFPRPWLGYLMLLEEPYRASHSRAEPTEPGGCPAVGSRLREPRQVVQVFGARRVRNVPN